MGKTGALGLVIAGLLLGGAAGFLVSRSVGDDGATRVLADALVRESTVGPSAWPVALTAASSIAAAVLLPLTVVAAMGLAGRKERYGREGERGESRIAERPRPPAGSCRVRSGRDADSVGGVDRDPARRGRSRLRLLAARLADRDRE